MQLAEIFEKQVDRQIEGVIKADDNASLRTEIEEYVLTQEVEKRLETFFDAYNNYHGSNGVWISGFFGSGKSHLLKMLAYLLESDIADDGYIVESFLEKTRENRILSAEIERAVRIPSRSILFNIDQKATVISKQEFDALLGVFVKVFDEMQGYFGSQGHIAQFERDLDKRGLYQAFKDEYHGIAGQSWEKGREESLLEGHNIAQAYMAIANAPQSVAEGILDKYRKEYRVSIEDFAEMVKDYIERQEPDFRLNFFVDEVGQYIADNVKLMTNLQTIAESLATRCRGRAWLIVTAQEAIEDVTGKMGKQHGNDFSKIQDRFKIRPKLTSANVSEVIQKRLLSKNGEGQRQLSHLYDREVNNFKTLFDFADGSPRYRSFTDLDHFTNSYPFIPYQFVLFQSAIQSLSDHNAFEGRHSSVGERSMLAVFQQVAIHIGNHRVGQLATFDRMFEGIRNSLKTSIQRSIITAEDQLDNDFAIRILKALFLVKYVKEFQATVHNVSVLMTESFDQDIAGLRSDVQEALNILEQQTYIQRNGEIYEYLTDEEKDIEQEIKNTEIETTQMLNLLGEVVFNKIIRETKIRSDENQHDYPFTRKLDSEAFGSKYHELAINVITPFHQFAGNREVLTSRSMGEDELLIILAPDDRLVRDLQLYVQTNKYFQQNYNTAQSDQVKMILTNKQGQNNQRLEAIRVKVAELMSQANYIVNGTELDLNGADPQSKVFKGFHQLIRSTYTHLKMLGEKNYRDVDIPGYLNPDNDMFGEIEMSEAEHEIQNHITLQHSQGKRPTLSRLLEHFTSKPYGWPQAAILCNLAKLYARGRVEIRQDSNALEGNRLAEALINSHVYQYLILAPEEEYKPQQIRDIKLFYSEFFDKPAGVEEGKALGQLTRDTLSEWYNQREQLLNTNRKDYPFLSALEPVLAKVKEALNKPIAFYLTDFISKYADELLDMKDDYVHPILTFMNGTQREIYHDASEFLKVQDANFQAVGYDLALQIRDILDEPDCYRGDKMRQVNTLVDELRQLIEAGLEDAKAAATTQIEDMKTRLTGDDKFNQLNPIQKNDVLEAFKDVQQQIDTTDWIERVNGLLRTFEQRTFTDLLVQIDEWLAPEPELDEMDEEIVVVRPQYIRKGDIRVRFDKLALEDEDDVEAYLEQLKDAYVKQIRDGKRIQL